MTSHRYLYRKGDRLYFRRRIPGLSTALPPLMLSLHMTDRTLGHIWIGSLVQEFDQVLASFVFIQPPLPDQLVVQYFRHCLSRTLASLHRQSRMARMIGRVSEQTDDERPLYDRVLQSLIEDGVRKHLPPKRIDPAWSPAQLECALRIYGREAEAILSAERTRRIRAEFLAQSSTDLTSNEHVAQLREAELAATLVALRTAPGGADVDLEAVQQRAEEWLMGRARSVLTTPAARGPSPAPAPTAIGPRPVMVSSVTGGPTYTLQSSPATSRPSSCGIALPEVKPVGGQDRTDAPLATGPKAPPVRPPVPLPAPRTIADLIAHSAAVRDRATEARPDGYEPDLAQVFFRMAANVSLSDQVLRQRASDLRLFSFITGLTRVDEIRPHHLTYWADTLMH